MKIKYTHRILYPGLFLSLLILSNTVYSASIIHYPVNDYAGIVSSNDNATITHHIVQHRKKTGVQIAVLTIGSTGKQTIEQYSQVVADNWAGGSSERKDGLLFIVAVDDRKMRLEVGDGLRGYIPDYQAREVLHGIKDDLRSKRYSKGIVTVVKAVIKKTESIYAGQSIPVISRAKGALLDFFEIYAVIFVMGGLLGGLLVFLWKRGKTRKLIIISLLVLIWVALPIILQLVFPGAWCWKPLVYLSGTIAGSIIVGPFFQEFVMTGKIMFSAFGAISSGLLLFFIIKFLDIMKPNPFGTTQHETIMFAIMICVNLMVQLPLSIFFLPGSSAGGHSSYSSSGSDYNSNTNYASSYNSSSSSYSSGSSSDSSSWSGGGGSFSGGGASSSW